MSQVSTGIARALLLSTQSSTPRSFRRWLLGILAVAGLWRIVIALLLPAISRDGVTFCWYARDLGTQGLAYLRTPEAAQHPLFPLLILGVQRLARLCGAPDTPLTWQVSGQVLAWLAGLAVVGLVGVIAFRLVRRLELPLDAHRVALFAAALAAILPLNVWLSADVMSDEVHLALYLGAIALLIPLDSARRALGCGVLGGLAFLTRPEGVVTLLGGLAAIWAGRARCARRVVAARALLVVAGFVVCATPYWMAVGRFSMKKDPTDLLGDKARAAVPMPVVVAALPTTEYALLAKLVRHDEPVYRVPFVVLYEWLRAGRVVVPLFALLPLLNLRRRFFAPPLVGLLVCLAGHVALTMVLLGRYDYLQPRHMLVPTVLLLPFAALLLARLAQLVHEQRSPAWGRAAIAVCLVPLVLYSLRIPNYKDRYLPETARWLRAQGPDLDGKTLLSGSGGRRIAFYADLRWQPWPEDPADYAVVVDHLRVSRPGWFAIEVLGGPERADDEHAGNRALVERLSADPQVTPLVGDVQRRPMPGGELVLMELR